LPGVQFDDEPRRRFSGGSVRLQPHEEGQLIQSGFSPGPSPKFRIVFVSTLNAQLFAGRFLLG
jgi:hypothetical protein